MHIEVSYILGKIDDEKIYKENQLLKINTMPLEVIESTKITIGKDRKIESIKLKINDDVI